MTFSFFLSCARRLVRAGPGLGLAGPAAGRSPHGEPARPTGGLDRGGRDRPTRRLALSTGPGAKLLKTPCLQVCLTVLGGACTYGRKQRSPHHGAVSLRCGVVPTRRAGAPPAGPPTPTYPASHTHSTPAAGGQTSRALESKSRSV